MAGCIVDPRMPEQVTHQLDEIVRFRMLMFAAGYEDGNDADALGGQGSEFSSFGNHTQSDGTHRAVVLAT